MAATMTRAQAMVDHGTQDRQVIWHSTQDPALKRSNDLKGMFVFSRDKRKGYDPRKKKEPPKQYTSVSLRTIHRYMNTRDEAWHRCVYEIIRESYPDGTPVASKLNIDVDLEAEDCDDFLERGRRFHELLVPDLRVFLAKTLDEDFLDEAKTPMIVMDSTSPKKFSLHYVLGGIMFENNYHAGAMIRAFREHVIQKYGPPETPGHPYFYMKKVPRFEVDGTVWSFMLDLSIYTINRPFRMLGNCKFTKKVMMIPLGMPRSEQYTRKFTFEELRESIVQDPILAETCKIYSVRELDGSMPHSQSVSRKIIAKDDALNERRGRILTAEEMRKPRGPASDTGIRVPADVAKALCDVLHVLLPRVFFSPTHVKYKATQGVFVVPQTSESTYCYIINKPHSNNASYVTVSCSRGTFETRCHKATCLTMNLPPDARTHAMPESLRRVIDGFLASASSSGHKPVALGPVFALVLDAEKKIPADYVHVPLDDGPLDFMANMDLDMEVPESQERSAWD